MSKDKRTEQEIIADIRKDLTGLEQRALTVKQVESSIWKLWGFVRENRNSLDSERCCRMIQGVVNGAVESVTKHAESLAAELDEAQQKLLNSNKEVKRLRNETEKLLQENVDLTARIFELTPKDETEGHPDAA